MQVDNRKFETWMSQKAPRGLQCSCCGTTDWAVEKDFMEVRPFAGGTNMMFDKVGYRYVTVTCRNCSNTLFFDAALMGDVSLDSALTPALASYHEGGSSG